jgi:hypothetical protein
MKRVVVAAAGVAVALTAAGALAHHGWDSYDAANPVTVSGPMICGRAIASF